MSIALLENLWTGKISVESFQSFILSNEEPISISESGDNEFIEKARELLKPHKLNPDQISMHLLFGLVLFNRRYFWEAHEVLEDIWLESIGEVKTFYQGIIQISAAMYHVLNQNKEGYKRLSHLGSQKLSSIKTPYLGVDYSAAIVSLEHLNRHLNDSTPFDFNLIPKLKFIDIYL